MRLWLLDRITSIQGHIATFVEVAADRAASEIDALMPGYTHLQRAQPIRWSHWVLSHAWAMQRDIERLTDLRKRVNVMPLGSGALAGHPFGIDRVALAADLNFASVSQNSMDAVAD